MAPYTYYPPGSSDTYCQCWFGIWNHLIISEPARSGRPQRAVALWLVSTHMGSSSVADIPISLRSQLAGDLLVAGNTGYDQARTVWNAMVDQRPGLIARCANTGDVRSHGRGRAESGCGPGLAGQGRSSIGSRSPSFNPVLRFGNPE